MSEEFKNQTPLDNEKKEEPQYVTAEQLSEMKSQIANDVRSELGRISKLVETKLETATKTDEKTKTETTSKRNEAEQYFEQERQKLAKEKELVNKARIRSSLEASLMENGAKASAIKLAADSLMMRNQDKIKSEVDPKTGESQILFQESDYADPMVIGDFVKGFLKSPEGEVIMQQKAAPSVNVPGGKRVPTGDVIRVNKSELYKLDPKVLKSGKVEIID